MAMVETAGQSLFYLFAALALALSVAVVTSRRILRAAVHLAGVLVCGAAFYLQLGAEFLAGIQVLVYVGGIVVLLVFAVMLTGSVEMVEPRPDLGRRVAAGLVALGVFGGGTAAAVWGKFAPPVVGTLPVPETLAIGRVLLDTGGEGYVLPFEMMSLLLLAAIFGALVVARLPGGDKTSVTGLAGVSGAGTRSARPGTGGGVTAGGVHEPAWAGAPRALADASSRLPLARETT